MGDPAGTSSLAIILGDHHRGDARIGDDVEFGSRICGSPDTKLRRAEKLGQATKRPRAPNSQCAPVN